MITPTITRYQYVDEKGYLTSQAQLDHDVLNNQMQQCLSDDGFIIPSRTSSEIIQITNPSNPSGRGNGTIWYATDLNKFVGLQNGILVSFNTTPI